MFPYAAATVLAALLTWAAFPPLDLGWLAFVAPAPFLWALRTVERPGQALGLGFTYAALFWGAMLYWIATLGFIAWIPLSIGFGLYGAAYGGLVWLARRRPAWQWWLVAVGGWALAEFLRARWPFAGLPWGSLGYAVGAMAWPRGAAQWIGASGLGVVAAGLAAGMALLFEDRERTGFVAYPAAAVVLVTAVGGLWPPSADGEVWQVAIIQGSTPCPRVHCLDEKRLIYESHIELTRSLPPGEFDLVVWGENASGGSYEPVGNPDVAADVTLEARRLDAYLMISGTRGVSDTEFLNVNLLFSPDGELIGEYRKRHPVPFGEYVPLREYLDWIPQLDQVPRDMVRGVEPAVFPTGAGTLGSVISFEGAFAREVRGEAELGARLLTVNTNESSYGHTPASDQLLGLTRVSAVENGIDIIHAAISGHSALIRADGSITAKSGLFTREILTGEVQWRDRGPTFYTRVGDWLQVLAMAVIPVGLIPWRRRADSFQPSRPAPRVIG